MVDIVKGILLNQGAQPDGLTNASRGMDVARTGRYDLIILDHNMPDMKGAEVLAQFKENSVTRDTPIVMLTGTSESETVKSYLKQGVAGYIVKPFKPDSFIEQLLKILGRYDSQYLVG